MQTSFIAKQSDHAMQLTVTITGNDKADMTHELLSAISRCDCNIVESRMSVLAGQFAGYLYVEGNWNHIAKLENTLETLGKKFNVRVQMWRVETASKEEPLAPYTIDIYAIDRNGILNEIVKFLGQRNIVIKDLSSSRFIAPQSQTKMFTAHLIIGIPTGVQPISLRDDFLDFSDRMNIDAILEPPK